MNDMISRQAAIDALDEIRHALWEIDIPSPTVPEYVEHHEQVQSVWKLLDKKQKELYLLPPAHPDRLTDKDFETIRIHLITYKRKLCSKQRWKEAEVYQRIIDRFMAFASMQPEQQQLERKKGKWMILKDEYGDIVEAVCSNCHMNGRHEWTYCPHCGADMRGKADE